jgi:hypothetical protein
MEEKHDLADKHPDIVARLTKYVETAREELGDYDKIGKAARFFDPGAPRPDMNNWKKGKKRTMAGKK